MVDIVAGAGKLEAVDLTGWLCPWLIERISQDRRGW